MTAARALRVSTRELDNILGREAVDLLQPGERGRVRQITERVVEQLAVALLLHRELGTPMRRSVALAGRMLTGDGALPLGAWGSIRLDMARMRREVAAEMQSALEETPRPRRGRPPTAGKDKRGAFG